MHDCDWLESAAMQHNYMVIEYEAVPIPSEQKYVYESHWMNSLFCKSRAMDL